MSGSVLQHLLLVGIWAVSAGCFIFVSLFYDEAALRVPSAATKRNGPSAAEDAILRSSAERITANGMDDMLLQCRRYDRFTLVLIDALRFDVFTNTKHFPLMGELLANGTGVVVRSVASPPTVTLPRLKSILSGTEPKFRDVLFNFFQSSYDDETLITVLKQKRKYVYDETLVAASRPRNESLYSSHISLSPSDGFPLWFFGDDTWLNMFPRLFDRFDGVKSFFVSDYTTVDDNVTRHFADEIQQTDRQPYGGRILHYLGVDHIGHFTGKADSPLMARKLAEMDGVLHDLWQQIASPSRRGTEALVVLSDHGMTEMGSHGGATEKERDTVFAVFDASGFRPQQPSGPANIMQQVDVSVVLAYLLGVRPPSRSQGSVTAVLLSALSPSCRPLVAAHSRCRATSADDQSGLVAQCVELQLLQQQQDAPSQLPPVCRDTQSASQVQQCLSYASAGGGTTGAHPGTYHSSWNKLVTAAVGLACTTLAVVLVARELLPSPPVAAKGHPTVLAGPRWLRFAVIIVHFASQFASSFVEEEYLVVWTAYVSLAATAVVAHMYEHKASGIKRGPLHHTRGMGAGLFVQRLLCRSWTCSGILHFNSDTSIAAQLRVRPFAAQLLACSVVVGHAFITSSSRRRSSSALFIVAALCFCGCRGTDMPFLLVLSPIARLYCFWIGVAVCAAVALRRVFATGRKKYQSTAAPLVLGLSFFQPTEVAPALIMLWWASTATTRRLLHWCKGIRTPGFSGLLAYYSIMAVHFAAGRSIALSSVAFSHLYVAVSDFDAATMGFLLMVSHYGPMLIGALAWVEAASSNTEHTTSGVKKGSEKSVGRMVTAMSALLFASACINAGFHSDHLFSWSVFLPKLVSQGIDSTVVVLVVAPLLASSV